jgi:beta-glucosidase
MLNFPEKFLWGTSTSAFQVEGAVHEDGRGESIWDRFAHTPGKILNNDNADVACDHYHRYDSDIKLMKDLGYKSYRFSIAWPRIFPEGRGALNQKGIDFYSRLVDRLLESNIIPNATLYHWDLPVALGGWESRDTCQAFAEYADAVTRCLGDRVKTWSTFNEPWCSSLLSYGQGVHAPGLTDPALALKVAHHLLLAHGMAMPIIRANCPDGEAGIVLNLVPSEPLTDSQADYEAYRFHDGYFNRWFLDPVFGRRYPADIIDDYVKMGWLTSPEPDYIWADDFKMIAAPLDFLGINYYERAVLHAVPGKEMQPGQIGHWRAAREQMTDLDWEIYPDGLHNTLVAVYYSYRPKKLYIAENGACYIDAPNADGFTDDQRRIAYLDGHLRAIHRAIQAGVPLAGYYVWSLMDNFEWSNGFSKPFGLVATNYTTQERLPRASAYWYGQVAQRNGLEL